MNVNEVAVLLATVLAEAVEGTIGENVFIGRIPQANTTSGLYCVATAPGSELSESNIYSYKTVYQFEVRYQDVDASKIYASDQIIRSAFSQIPFNDEINNPTKITKVAVLPLSDQDLVEAEQRVGSWSVIVTTLNNPETE